MFVVLHFAIKLVQRSWIFFVYSQVVGFSNPLVLASMSFIDARLYVIGSILGIFHHQY